MFSSHHIYFSYFMRNVWVCSNITKKSCEEIFSICSSFLYDEIIGCSEDLDSTWKNMATLYAFAMKKFIYWIWKNVHIFSSTSHRKQLKLFNDDLKTRKTTELYTFNKFYWNNFNRRFWGILISLISHVEAEHFFITIFHSIKYWKIFHRTGKDCTRTCY